MNIAQEAESLIEGDRHDEYGHYAEAFKRHALAWTGILLHKLKPGEVIEERDVTLMMTALKLNREANRHKRDNVKDGIGYLLLHNKLHKDTPQQ